MIEIHRIMKGKNKVSVASVSFKLWGRGGVQSQVSHWILQDTTVIEKDII